MNSFQPAFGIAVAVAVAAFLAGGSKSLAEPLHYSVSWVGNSFPGSSNKWVQNFFIHTRVQPDGTVNT